MSNDPTPLDNAKDSSQVPDFSDIVQGEDLEFRQSKAPTFPVVHKIEKLGDTTTYHTISTFKQPTNYHCWGSIWVSCRNSGVSFGCGQNSIAGTRYCGENLKYNGF